MPLSNELTTFSDTVNYLNYEDKGETISKLVTAYNNFTNYCKNRHDNIDDSGRESYKQCIIQNRETVINCLKQIQCEYEFSNSLYINIEYDQIININLNIEEEIKIEVDKFTLIAKRILKENISKNLATLNNYKNDILKGYNAYVLFAKSKYTDKNSKEKLNASLNIIKTKLEACLTKLNCNPIIPENFELIDVTQIEIKNVENTPTTMASNIEILRLCGETIPSAYSGDPLALQSFINSIDLLDSMATEQQKPLIVSFIKTRLNGKALEALTEANNTTESIKEALRKTIKPENEKIIRGKLSALRADRTSLQDFSKQAESLADSLKRALILDGIPAQKANSMVIEETIQMCKTSTRSDYVKSVMASATFATPKEAIAKFIIENGNEKAEKQVLAFRSNPNQPRNKFQRYPTNFQGNRNNFHRNQNNYNNYGRNYRNNRNTFQNNNRNHFQNRNNNNAQYQNNYNGQSRNSNARNTRNVRVMGNSVAPQRQLGDHQQQEATQQNN